MLAFKVNSKVVPWRLEPTVDILAVEAFRKIYNADPIEGLKDLLFIWGMRERKSPYGTSDPRTREAHTRKNIYGATTAGPQPGEPRYDMIEWGFGAYEEYSNDAGDRLLDQLDGTVDDLTNYIKQIREKGVTTSSEAQALVSVMTNVNNILKNKKEAEKLIKQGAVEEVGKIKGGAKRSPLEMGFLDDVIGSKNKQRGSVEDDDNEEGTGADEHSE